MPFDMSYLLCPAWLRYGLYICCITCSLVAGAQNINQQDANLAQNFLNQGEYEKAALLYEKLYAENPNTSVYYRNYYKSLMGLRRFADAEALVQQQLKIFKGDALLYLDMANIYKEKGESEKSRTEIERVIKEVKEASVSRVATELINMGELDAAITVYENAEQQGKTGKRYLRDLAGAYQQKGEIEKAINACLEFSNNVGQSMNTITTMLQRMTNKPENMELLQTQLYSRIAKDSDNPAYPDLLVWSFVQQKDFESAILQAKAIDRRNNEEGTRLMGLAGQAIKEQQYDAAIDAYNYVIEKGEAMPRYTEAKIRLLECRNEKVTTTDNYTEEDLLQLKKDYLDFLAASGKTPATATAMRDLSHLYAFYLNDITAATALSQEIVNMPTSTANIRALSRLDLGDYYLIADDIWEATLYYSQVDKAFKEDILGEEARFRNAKLSYYNGDFEWAQAQLNALKASTSELISNDAIKLSVFITDNSGLDTMTTPMAMYARTDLLLLQNKTAAAIATLDSINRLFPGHALSDDILYTRAKLASKGHDYIQAADYLQEIITKFGTDILADDAIFMLAELYAQHLKDPQKAMELYQSILVEHPDSLYTVEARKKYRQLRGDAVN